MCAANSAPLSSSVVENTSANLNEVVCQSELSFYKTLYVNKAAPVVPVHHDEQEHSFVVSEN